MQAYASYVSSREHALEAYIDLIKLNISPTKSVTIVISIKDAFIAHQVNKQARIFL